MRQRAEKDCGGEGDGTEEAEQETTADGPTCSALTSVPNSDDDACGGFIFEVRGAPKLMMKARLQPAQPGMTIASMMCVRLNARLETWMISQLVRLLSQRNLTTILLEFAVLCVRRVGGSSQCWWNIARTNTCATRLTSHTCQ